MTKRTKKVGITGKYGTRYSASSSTPVTSAPSTGWVSTLSLFTLCEQGKGENRNIRPLTFGFV
ncbi:hypothetical protein BDQ94DRAFT_150903 [Aspergillus welwitschiae]|uniref:Uncharacterized protein n=1 Tax=Aspergillus welwitschiae TaxID=1341132 RepID=A0A3F3PQW0_9EURO|nr:hypothetical protein BDQ94DRAFT_150903 [Aspergillus welwitschiae]RDH29294.1 hypothetical protein BDQ94DRAFT_150903 [Aspergillus welwitschiae]